MLIYPEMPALQASAIILAGLLDSMLEQESQIGSKDSAEALHDYRITVRKIRVVLAQFEDLLPGSGVPIFRKSFSVVMENTSYLRDLEAFRYQFSGYASSKSVVAGHDFGPLLRYIDGQERVERSKILRYFKSVRYRKLKTNWETYIQDTLLTEDSGRDTSDGSNVPIVTVVREAIAGKYSKTARQASRISRHSPIKSFHTLRKSCKKLRYLLELFGDAFPRQARKELISDLKQMQGKLGELQDAEVHLCIIRKYLDEIEEYLDRDKRKAINRLIKTIKKNRKLMKTDAAEVIRKYAGRSAKKIDLLLKVRPELLIISQK